ncbi:MAG: hypothetical protein Kow00128_09880 [Deltaproteobacteria bacterium]
MREPVHLRRNEANGGTESASLPASALLRIARICALGLALPELLDETCRELASLCGAQSCYLATLPGKAGTAGIRRAPEGEDLPDLREAYRHLARDEEFLGRLLQEGILVCPDLGELSPDHPLRARLDPSSVRSLILLPLRFGTALNGLLALHAHGAPRRWDGGEPALLREIAPVLSAALERNAMEERILASEARYRFLAENALDLISLHDLSGTFLYVSPASRKMLGYRPEEMTGVPAEAFLHPDDLERMREGDRRIAGGEAESVTLEHRIRRKEGGFREVETVSSPVRGPRGEIRRILRITRDITERKQMESRLAEGQRLETIGLLAGGVAHEFNNLLVGINGTAEMLTLLLAGNEEALPYLATIERLGNRAVELTRQLLAYARQGGQSPELLSLSRLVTEDFPALRASIPPAVEIRLETGEETPPVSADPFRVRQMIMSLGLNAAEAMPEGGTITIRTGRIESLPEGPRDSVRAVEGRLERTLVSAGDFRGPYAVIEIADTGCGMTEETLKRIFQPFFSTKFIGRGMGLAALRGIVENHGGMIRVSTAPGGGTSVTIGFPAAEGKAPEEPAREPLPACGSGTILLADDEEDVREVVRAMLESFGYAVLTARDGREALEIFRERREAVDLVLLDMMMPGMTGAEAFAGMRRISPGIPGILASGYDVDGTSREFASAGFSAFLQKPFRRGELGRTVSDVLGKAGRAEKRGEG